MLIARDPSSRYPFKFDRQKAIEVILYLCHNAPISDRIHICKILYFADKYHMEKFARLICGDWYAAMPRGPVPSNTYRIIKAADRGAIPEIAVNDYDVIALREPNEKVFSKSDIEALNWAIREYGNLPVGELIDISHDEVWRATTDNGQKFRSENALKSIPIPLDSILLSLEDGEDLLDYVYQYNHA